MKKTQLNPETPAKTYKSNNVDISMANITKTSIRAKSNNAGPFEI